MSANINPIFTLTPIIAMGLVSAANTNRDGTGTLVDIATGGVNGTKIESVRVKGIVTTTAGMIRLYVNNGSATRLIKEIVVSAITVGAGVAGFESEWIPDIPFVLPSTYVLRASTHNAESFIVAAIGADF